MLHREDSLWNQLIYGSPRAIQEEPHPEKAAVDLEAQREPRRRPAHILAFFAVGVYFIVTLFTRSIIQQ